MPLWLGDAPRRWTEVPAQSFVNLSSTSPDGYPAGLYVVWRPTELEVQSADVERLLDAVHPLVRSTSSYWFDDGSGVAGLAMVAWLHRRNGWALHRALEEVRPKATLLTAELTEAWLGHAA